MANWLSGSISTGELLELSRSFCLPLGAGRWNNQSPHRFEEQPKP
ncbi:MAG: hypothetical protein NTZ53_06365 [Cyanobacteria bacterium]|nr:hypothetical protein [Cyanobacteriota bacterium]